jgi:arginine-tRNA-protein transferase
VETFKPSKSHRRCWKQNADLRVEVNVPQPTDEAFALYRRYQREWHHKADEPESEAREGFEQFLYHSSVPSLEFRYRDATGALLAVGICDLMPAALSSVYFYFDPDCCSRGLGTYGALHELDYARQHQLPFYYLGFWIADCKSMRYKGKFRPCELLREDGEWVPASDASDEFRREM